MDRFNSFNTRAQTFAFLILLFAVGLSYENTTKCIYTSIEGVQTFEFVCEPDKAATEYFTNGRPIFCESATGNSFYKERRHEIKFRDCYFKQLPVIFKWYRSVRRLNVSSLGLETLQSQNFENAENALVTLIASHNLLTEIQPLLFDNAKKVSVVDLSFNRISRFDPMAFNADNNVTLLNLSHNLLEQIENGTLANLSRLEMLDLSFNRIADIPEGLFGKLTYLSQLNLRHNLILQMQCTIFADLTNLNMLDLTRNKLQIFNSSCVQSKNLFSVLIEGNQLIELSLSPNVSEINVSGNNITNIPIGFGLQNVTVFNTSRNAVDNILDLIKQLSSQLRILDVSDSKIGQLNVSTLESFDDLEYLSLRNTGVSNIKYGTFYHQQKLRYLDLSDNDLKKINFHMLHWNSEQLEVLYLDGNNLDDLSNLTKSNYPSLERLSIDNNNFDCDYLSQVQHQWKKEGISVVTNPHIMPVARTTDTHVNGITCFHNSESSEIQIEADDFDVGVAETKTATKVANKVETVATVTDSDALNSMRRVEIFLIIIIVVLACLLVLMLHKNKFFGSVVGAAVKTKDVVNEFVHDRIHYTKKTEDEALIV